MSREHRQGRVQAGRRAARAWPPVRSPGAIFRQVWKVTAGDGEAPNATDEDRGWGEILAAAALQGPIFAVVRAAVDRGGAVGVRRMTGRLAGLTAQRRRPPSRIDGQGAFRMVSPARPADLRHPSGHMSEKFVGYGVQSFCVRGLLFPAVARWRGLREVSFRGPPQAPLLENGQSAARRASAASFRRRFTWRREP